MFQHRLYSCLQEWTGTLCRDPAFWHLCRYVLFRALEIIRLTNKLTYNYDTIQQLVVV